MKQINLRGSVIPHYLIWEHLANLYLEHHKVSWDLVCDLNIIETLLNKGNKEIWWLFSTKNKLTEIRAYDIRRQYPISDDEQLFYIAIQDNFAHIEEVK